MIILVTGATGQIGRLIIEALLEAGHSVRALTRDPDRARAVLPDRVDVRQGDLTNIESLEPVFAGIDALHLITFGGDDGADLTNGAEIIGLAERSGIKRISVLSGWSPTSVEVALERSSIASAVLQPVDFMGNAKDWIDEIRETGTVSTLASYPTVAVHEADIAAVAACALTEDGHAGHEYRLTGPAPLTPAERTAIISSAINRELRHVQLTEDQERERLASYGMGEEFVEFGIELAMNPPEGASRVEDTVKRVTTHPARTFEQWVHENAELFR